MSLKSKLLTKLYYQYVGTSMSIFSRWPLGTNVFELDWDVLLILDTCRVDALREVEEEYDFINDIGSIISVGSNSPEWIANTFVKDYQDELNQTVYVSANAFAKRVLQEREFPDTNRGLSWSKWRTVTDDELLDLDQPWRYAPDPPHGHIRPEHVTDRAIANAREYNPERLVVHYSQPHSPYTATADRENRPLEDYEADPRTYLKNGGDRKKVWNAYIDNLRLVLDEVEVILDNIDAETVAISADHGEAFGEGGVYWHLAGVPHPYLKRVPWVETTASNTGDYEPSLTRSKSSKSVEQQLQDLGYLDDVESGTQADSGGAPAPGLGSDQSKDKD
jgi:hypothetical protein